MLLSVGFSLDAQPPVNCGGNDGARPWPSAVRPYNLRPQTQRILRAVPTRSKSLSLVTKVALRAWARAAAKQPA